MTDPVKQDGGSLGESSYITYKVNYTANLDGFSGSGTVVRRYSDFVWLSDTLNLAVPGCIIPSLPPKQTVGRFGSEFVNGRRRGLEKFMQRLCLHPELQKSEYLRKFLDSNDKEFKDVMKISQGLKPNKLTSVADSIKSKWNAYVVTGTHIELENDVSSAAVDKVLEYITKIEEVMSRVVDRASLLTERSRKTAHSLREFGQSFVSYGVAEGSDLGDMLHQVGSTLDGLSSTEGKHAAEQIEKLLEPLAEQARVLESVKTAISIRAERRQHYVQELTQLEALQVSYNKLQGQEGKESSALAKAKQIEDCHNRANDVKADFENMTARLLKDFGDFQVRKGQEIQQILLAFVDLQVHYHKENLDLWGNLAPGLESITPRAATVVTDTNEPDPILTDVMSPEKVAPPPAPAAPSAPAAVGSSTSPKESVGGPSEDEEYEEETIGI